MPAAYLETLNPQQRRAAEHGVEDKHTTPGEPLLIIAGAGSGKTNTLAHRVAHLIVNGADPRRILLMTFSRRAAAEMTRSVERITRQVVGNTGRITTDALTRAGMWVRAFLAYGISRSIAHRSTLSAGHGL
jgi:DNA helicase-2/ATP-dependent DNA helicase PcrA